MECICAIYELNRYKAQMRTWQKFRTTRVTFTFHILTWNSYATNNHLMGCTCVTYEAIRSDRHGATEQTLQKLSNGRLI